MNDTVFVSSILEKPDSSVLETVPALDGDTVIGIFSLPKNNLQEIFKKPPCSSPSAMAAKIILIPVVLLVSL